MNTDTAKGLFITFEGIDGAGKSSHIASTGEALRQVGREVIFTREPGGTELAETLRRILLNEEMDPLTEGLLMFAARREHLVNVIEPALARGAVVLCDRFTDSSFAYQGYGRGFDLQILSQLEQWVQQGIEPDLTLWFDLPAEIAAQRMSQARLPDRFESESRDFFEKVRTGYSTRMQQFPERIIRIDAAQDMADVALQVTAVLHNKGIA